MDRRAGVQITRDHKVIIQTATVTANRRLCREQYRLTFRVNELPGACAGQFVHLRPDTESYSDYRTRHVTSRTAWDEWQAGCKTPLLRRAFSIAGLTRALDVVDAVYVDVIYRVVGLATRWMESLKIKDCLSVLGPLGNGFPIHDRKSVAWLAAGGVGLPPMLWLAEALHERGKHIVAFCGAQTADLLALTVNPGALPANDASRATSSCKEFAENDAPVVISTDDGSLGFRGHVGAAMAAFHSANPTASDELVVYACGPEPMMRFVAQYCLARDIECYVCKERSMACGTGMCQSCVVPVHDETDAEGWRYRLCCTEGPVFDAAHINWGYGDAATLTKGISRMKIAPRRG
ncbi:MAG: dihydroorotate dehydrogenase electron transfer subunit [Phycisphaerae bacterium]